MLALVRPGLASPCPPLRARSPVAPARLDAGAPASPDVLTEERTKTLDELLPPYVVVLHNDDVNDMLHVVQALLASVPELTQERAAEIMLTAHTHGKADVVTCPLERAELYRDRLQSHGLTATIHRA